MITAGHEVNRSRLRDCLDVLFSTLLSERGEAKLAWREFAYRFQKDAVRLGEALPRNVEESARIELLGALLIVLARGAYADLETRSRFFRSAERMGFHLLPATFYSPIPLLTGIEDRAWSTRFSVAGFDDSREQLTLLSQLAAFANDFARATNENRVAKGYRRDNGSFGLMDASIYYAMIRHYRPARIIEIGGGQSTMVAQMAARQIGLEHVRCIDPEPSPELELDAFIRLSRLPVQAVPVSEFAQLSANDILFIDGTHVSKFGSDVNYVVLQILPELAAGVVVHFHDVFLPFEYPRSWLEEQLFWNEQYLLGAMLGFGDTFQILLGNHFLAVTENASVRALLPHIPIVGGGSLWLRKRDDSRNPRRRTEAE